MPTKGVDYIIYICFGNHPKAKPLRDLIPKILKKLQEEQFVSAEDLAVLLGLDLRNDAQRAKFYRIMSPLMGQNPLNIRFIAGQRTGGRTEYYLAKDAFDATFDNTKKDITYIYKK